MNVKMADRKTKTRFKVDINTLIKNGIMTYAWYCVIDDRPYIYYEEPAS